MTTTTNYPPPPRPTGGRLRASRVLVALVAVLSATVMVASVAGSQTFSGKLTKRSEQQTHQLTVSADGTLTAAVTQDRGQIVTWTLALLKDGQVVASAVAGSPGGDAALTAPVTTGGYTLRVGAIEPVTKGKGASYRLTTGVEPDVGNQVELRWSVAEQDGWRQQLKGPGADITIVGDQAHCVAGIPRDFTGEWDSTNYARIRRMLPEEGLVVDGPFVLESTFELPADYYDRQMSYMRLLTTDNYPGTLQGTTTKIGAADGDEWRIGFTIYGSDSIFRLISERENNADRLNLWTADSQLPAGQTYTVRMEITPARDTTGSWALFINGTKVGGADNVQTVPTSVTEPEMVVTRVAGCIDGAANQTEDTVQVNLESIVFRTDAD